MNGNLKKFISSCTLTFKAFDHEVTMTAGKASLWQFNTVYRRTGKKYAVYCAPDLKKVKSLIKIALKKIPGDTRLVVVTKQYGDEDLKRAQELNYTLLTFEALQEKGQEMLELQDADSSGPEAEQPDEVIDKAIEKDKLF